MKREIRTGQKLRWALSRLGGGDGESRWKNDQTPNKCIFRLLQGPTYLCKSFFPGKVVLSLEIAFTALLQSYFSPFTRTFELRPLWSYFSRRTGGKSSGEPSANPPLL